MTAQLTSEGLRFMVESVLRQPLRLRLFANDYLPQIGDSANAYKEVQGYGYRDSRLQVVSVASTSEGIKAAFAPITFQFDGPAGRVYGSYAVHEATGVIVWADPLPEVFKAVNRGDSLTIEPVFTMMEVN